MSGARAQQLMGVVAAGPPEGPADKFLAEGQAGLGVGQTLEPGLSKRRKAQRYRDLTCPRTRTSLLADGTRIVTVGSHVLVYPAAPSGKSEPEPGAKHQPTRAAAEGAVTTFEEHPICHFPDDSFKHYSLGVGLYFKGVRLLAWIFALCALLTLPSIVLSVWSSSDGTTESGMFFEKTTIGNFGAKLVANSTAEVTWDGGLSDALTRGELILILSVLDVAACLALLAFGEWLRRRQETEARSYSKREITVKKYSVQVSGLPPSFHSRFKLAQWFQQRFGPVVDCAIAFDQHDLLELYRSRGILRKDIDQTVAHGETARLDSLYAQLEKLDNRIHEVQKDMGHRRTLGAFVTFEHQESRIACEKAFRNLWLKSLKARLATQTPTKATPGGSAAAASAGGNESLLFGSSQCQLLVRQAPEPSNVLFKNLKFTRKQRMLRRFLTFLATLLLILISVVAVYIAQRFQSDAPSTNQQCAKGITADMVRQDSSLTDCFCYDLGTASALDSQRQYGIDCGSWLTAYAIARGLSVLSVLTIVLVNLILKLVIKRLTRFEKHHSFTKQQESVTNKLFVGLFLNTAIVLLVVNAQFQRYGDMGFTLASDGAYSDFIYSWFVHVGSSIVLTMAVNSINPHLLPVLQSLWRRWRRDSLCAPRRADPQSLWNARYAGAEFELAERYAVLLNTIFVTLLYSGGMPILLPIAALTFLLTYWFDKISFLRLYRIPPRFDHTLASYTTTMLPYAVFLHLAFALWFLSSPALRDAQLTAEDQTVSTYVYDNFQSRLSYWATLPVLVLFALVGAYLLIFRLGVRLYRAWTGVTEDDELNSDASKFVPYSVARRTVTLETYHPHGSPYFHDAFIRTPSRKQMAIPTPLHILEEQAQKQALAKQQAQAEKHAYATRQPAEAEILDPDAKRAASMGIRKRNMSVSLEYASLVREAAKGVAARNQSRAARLSAGIQDTPHSMKRILLEEQAQAQAAQTQAETQASTPNNGKKKARKDALSPLPVKPPSLIPGRATQGEPIVVLDIAEETATQVQENVEMALVSPSPPPSVERLIPSEEAADVEVDDGAEPPRPFTSHLQHHAGVSMPARDPLLPAVKTHLHRMADRLHSASEGPAEDAAAAAAAREKKEQKRKKKAAKNKAAAVHDSSTLSEEVGDVVSSITRADPPSAARLTPSTSAASADDDPDADASQLVPTPCPNGECARVLELVDTGVPQLYHCPFCATAFIM